MDEEIRTRHGGINIHYANVVNEHKIWLGILTKRKRTTIQVNILTSYYKQTERWGSQITWC